MKAKDVFMWSGVALVGVSLFGETVGRTLGRGTRQLISGTVSGVTGGVSDATVTAVKDVSAVIPVAISEPLKQVSSGISTGTESVIKSILIQPYEWAMQQRYIPIIDDVAYALAWLKAGFKKPAGAEHYYGILR